jgi:hypothetical protein
MALLTAEQPDDNRADAARERRSGVFLAAHRGLELPAQPTLYFIEVAQRKHLDIQQQIVVATLPLLRQRDLRLKWSLGRARCLFDRREEAE